MNDISAMELRLIEIDLSRAVESACVHHVQCYEEFKLADGILAILERVLWKGCID